MLMKTAKLFLNGQSQAVRLPREFRFDGTSVFVQRFGDLVMLMPMETNPWKSMFDAAEHFSSDFMSTRDQGIDSKREMFD
jgi:antitoxin VapB